MSPHGSVLLRGLHPRPLASYLGALGVLRICGQQYSNRVSGAFGDEGFLLHGIDERTLLDLLLDRWVPTPIVTPWNNASGFYDSNKGRLAASAIEALTEAKSSRFDPLVRVIGDVRRLIAAAGYKEAPKDEEKAGFIASLRGVLSDDGVAWLDAVTAVDGDDARMMPVLGSGGNEGVLDYSGLFLRSLVDTLLGDRARSERLLAATLFGRNTSDLLERPGGQFDPGTAGGFNTGPGFESKGLPNNPWSFVLLLEGSVVWASGIASRQQGLASGYRLAVSPFTVRHRAAGYGSAGDKDDDPQRVRAEVWMPVWRRQATHGEVASFIAEGRVEVGNKTVKRATDSLDFVDAVASLGVDRGVDAFVRYAFMKRRGDSFVALPAGVVEVRHRREADLLLQLDTQLDVLDRFYARFPSEQGPPALFVGLRRNIDEARYDVAVRGGEDAVVRLVRAIGALEMTLARRDPGKEPNLSRPLGGLSADWVSVCGDAVEVHLAAALASVERARGAGPIRSYLAPLDPDDSRKYAPAPRALAWSGVDLSDRLANVLQRRLLDASTRGDEDIRKKNPGFGDATAQNPTFGLYAASLDHVAAFLALADGDRGTQRLVDERALEELMFGFTWVNHRRGRAPTRNVEGTPPLPRSYALLKLLFAPRGVPVDGHGGRDDDNVFIAPDSAIVPRLGGDGDCSQADRAGRRASTRDGRRRPRCCSRSPPRRGPADPRGGRGLATSGRDDPRTAIQRR